MLKCLLVTNLTVDGERCGGVLPLENQNHKGGPHGSC